MTAKAPVVTLIVATACLIIFYNPALLEKAFYDRQAILNGQLWRFFTAPLAHFSTSHVAWNLFLFILFGTMLEYFNKQMFIMVLGVIALVTGMTYAVFSPELLYYGGMSGVLTGIIAYLGLKKISLGKRSKHLWTLVLILLFAKIIFEALVDQPIFVSAEESFFHILPSSHFIGGLVAVFFWFWEEKWRRPIFA